MKLFHFLNLTLIFYIRHAIAASGTPGVAADLDKQYRINFATTDTGGCNGFEDLLRTSYAEAFQVVGNAIDSLNIIKKAKPSGADSTALAKWGRIARVFSALFGAGEATFRRGGKFAPPTAVDNAIAKFQLMQEDIARNFLLNGVFSDNPPATIYCSDTWQQPLRPTDIDPLDTQTPKRQISITQPDVTTGLFFSIPDQKTGIMQTANFNPLCGPGNLAFTSRSFSAITFCPDTLNLKTSVSQSIVQRKTVIQANDPIGNHRTMAEMWIHEWNHLFSAGEDANAVSPTGAPLFDQNGNPGKTYGWDLTVNLAANNPAAAQNLPDAHAIFANAMFFDKFDWSNGHAVPFTI